MIKSSRFTDGEKKTSLDPRGCAVMLPQETCSGFHMAVLQSSWSWAQALTCYVCMSQRGLCSVTWRCPIPAGCWAHAVTWSRGSCMDATVRNMSCIAWQCPSFAICWTQANASSQGLCLEATLGTMLCCMILSHFRWLLSAVSFPDTVAISLHGSLLISCRTKTLSSAGYFTCTMSPLEMILILL
jgi:hypothetical protein